MCSYIESGFPILASIRRHVLLIVGHTLDFTATHHPLFKQSPQDNLGFVDSSTFWKRMIVVDDNAFPYATLGFSGDPANYLTRFAYPPGESAPTIENIRTAVIPLPEKVYLPWKFARKHARKVFEQAPDLLDRARQGADGPLVSRLFLTNGSSWKSKKVEAWLAGRQNAQEDVLLSIVADFRLPHFIWVLQTAPLSLYRKGLCTAEIVLDATAGQKDTPVLCGRVGNALLFRGDSADAATLKKSVSNAPVCWPLYRHNLGETP